MSFTKQLIAGATMATISALTMAQPATSQMPVAGDSAYPPARLTEAASTRNRAAVATEAVAALSAGRIARGELSSFEPQAQATTSEMTRAQVQAETLEARRLGLLDQAGELGVAQVTPAQSAMIHAAGLRARDGALIQAAR